MCELAAAPAPVDYWVQKTIPEFWNPHSDAIEGSDSDTYLSGDRGGRGWVAMPTAEGEQALKPGDWNNLEVSAQGPHIVTHLNGMKIVDFADTTPKFTDGSIALQIHTGGGVKMRWKDIYVKPQ